MENLKRIKADAVFFAEKILGFKPFPYQAEILREQNRRVCCVCGRQVGKSTVSAIKLIHYALTHPKVTCLIVSATLRQSMETFDKAVLFTDNAFLRSSVARRTRTQIVFRNGSRIVCLPCGRFGSTLRGYTASFIIVDEASFVPSEVIESVVFPMLSTTQGSLWLLTTPWSKDHVVYRVLQNPEWSRFHFPTSMNPLVTQEFLEEQRAIIGEDRFRMEYLGEFVDDSRSYFPMGLLEKCYGEPIADLNGGFGGWDVGGASSYSAFVVVKKHGSQIHVVHFEQSKASYTDYVYYLKSWHQKYGFETLCVDATGLGKPIVELLENEGVPVEAYTFTSKSKQDLLVNLKVLMEQARLVLPQDRALISSLNAIEFEHSPTGYKFKARSGSYTDLAYALALACWSLRQNSEVSITVISR